jgi:hypothetical protein
MPGGLRIIARGHGTATVQTTRKATFSGGIPFNGRISGSLPAGTVLTGRDSNNNGIPDIIEKPLKKGRIVFENTLP